VKTPALAAASLVVMASASALGLWVEPVTCWLGGALAGFGLARWWEVRRWP
jgi:hypothetical protein